MSCELPGAEFSHVIDVAQISSEGVVVRLTAGDAERKALARRFDILAVIRLEASVQIRPDPVVQGCYLATGQLESEVEQACVVSLEPVRQVVKEQFERRFAPVTDSLAPDEEAEELLDPDAVDPPDPLTDGRIDAGELVAEELALGLDPYPRKPGASLPEQYRPEPEQIAKVSPFAALAALKAAKKE